MTSALHSQLPIINSQLPPGYKQTEVGAIPDDWDAGPLRGKAAIAHGYPFASVHFVTHGPYRLTTPGHFYETGGFRDIGEKQKYYDGPVPSDYVLEPGDVIVAMTEQADGLLGSAAVIPMEHCYLHNQRLGRVSVLAREVELDYLVYVFNSPSYRAKVRETAAGTKVKHTSPEKLLEIPIRLPPLAEQRAIAGALSDVDVLIGALDQLIAKKRDLNQAAMQQLLTGQTRLPGFAPANRQFQQSEIGMLPEDWEVERVQELATIKTGSRNTQDRVEDGAYPFFVRSSTIERINSYSFDGEAVLTAGDGVGTGKVFHYVNGKFDIHQRVYKISDFSPRLVGRFFFLVFSTRFYDRIMSMTAKSSVDSVRMEMIADMLIPLPSASEQTAIAEVLSDMDAEIAALEQRREKTRALKQGMMQELLTGKTRLL